MDDATDLERELVDRPPAFVTYGWARTAYTVVRSLGRRGIEVHVGDASPIAMSRFSRHAASFHRLPDFYVDPDGYIDALSAAVTATGARVLLPAHEDTRLVIQHRHRFPPATRMAVPALADWRDAEDKLLYVERLRDTGVPVPRTVRLNDLEDVDRVAAEMVFPVVVKVRVGNSGKGVSVVPRRELLRKTVVALIDEYDLASERLPVVQQHIVGPKFGFLGVFDQGRHVSSIVFEILRSKGSGNFGTSTFRVTVDDEQIRKHAIEAMAALNWHGVVDMDWVRGGDGVARLIDINGRLGGATALTMAAEMDLPFAWYRLALGRASTGPAATILGARCRWVLGDALGFVDAVRNRRWQECIDVVRPVPGGARDDLHFDDPLPFFAQALDYGVKFLRAGGDPNPVTKGMLG
jgi:predicted ATP-grasp superfamily ATP-dependent carboligase